jgi:phage terminase Nu1 subunit (DNA packaging protein)
MNAADLCTSLDITPDTLASWLPEGLPHTPDSDGNEFDAVAVKEWLLSHGYASEPKIVTTLADVATAFNRHLQTVKVWRTEGMPGEPGSYDLDEIAAWLDSRGLRHGDDADAKPAADSRQEAERRRIWAIAKREELKTKQLQGQLVDVDEVGRLYAHHATHARALLEQIPDRLLGLLPPECSGDDKRRFRAEAAKAIDGVTQALCDWLTTAAEALTGGEEEGAPSTAGG